MATSANLDRLSIRRCPSTPSVMVQTWARLLFMHWPADPERLAGRLPPEVEIDTFDGQAWLGVIPFVMYGIRRRRLPPIPGLSAMHELNVRTYVHHRGVPGVWFFSLDASSPLMVWAARTFYHLPYLRARMQSTEQDGRVTYASHRRHRGAPVAHLDVEWEVGEPVARNQLGLDTDGSLDVFLTERYCLYTAHRGRILRGRIHHRPWPLRRAALRRCESSMLESHGLEVEPQPPLLHCAARLEVDIWPLEEVGGSDALTAWDTGRRVDPAR